MSVVPATIHELWTFLRLGLYSILPGRSHLLPVRAAVLGQGIARRFAEAGARVVAHYNSSEAGAQSVTRQIRESRGNAIAVQGDLTLEKDAARLVQRAVKEFERLDVLVDNAGTYPMHGVLGMTPSDWDHVVDANLRSVFLCTQAAAKIMKEHGAGAIVNINSIEAENPAPNHSHYNAAKGGVLMFTRASAYELAPHGIRVNAVAEARGCLCC